MWVDSIGHVRFDDEKEEGFASWYNPVTCSSTVFKVNGNSSSVSYNFEDQIVRAVKENFGIDTVEKKDKKKEKVWNMPKIKKVIFNEPATIVYWTDGTKTVVKCGEDDIFNKDAGIALCLMKKMYGNEGKFNNEIKKWCGYPKRKKK